MGMGAKKAKGLKGPRAAIAVIAAVLVLAAAAALMVWYKGLPLRYRYPLKYKEEILAACSEYGLEPCFVAAVINTESGYDADAVSRAGAVGLMQLMPSTAEWIASMRGVDYEEQRLSDPAYNIDMGCWLLSYLLERYNGNERYALIAYNAGSGTLEGWLKNEEYLNESSELSVIPYNETRNYVERIEKAIEKYERLYGEQLEKAEDRGAVS